ncbi:unnamed protein product [Protopolystoma xenopodis]|uniref:Uncharacterized protein n=1 Tax=Protopolystoma xenopodis TaxID=117903 RepID=A0A448XSX6_9PLAT|nr:unnamed protein product [Protopolystoma xenopodis]
MSTSNPGTSEHPTAGTQLPGCADGPHGLHAVLANRKRAQRPTSRNHPLRPTNRKHAHWPTNGNRTHRPVSRPAHKNVLQLEQEYSTRMARRGVKGCHSIVGHMRAGCKLGLRHCNDSVHLGPNEVEKGVLRVHGAQPSVLLAERSSHSGRTAVSNSPGASPLRELSRGGAAVGPREADLFGRRTEWDSLCICSRKTTSINLNGMFLRLAHIVWKI